MAGLKEIKQQILSVEKTRKVTRAMEAVSAVKMRKSQERALGARSYARSAVRILGQISSVPEFAIHPLVQHHTAGKTAVILVTSDKGLAGSLNSAVLKLAEKFVAKESQKSGAVDTSGVVWLCLGKRGSDWAERRGYEVAYSARNLSDGVTEAEMREITDKVVAMQLSGEVRKVNAIYTNFKSTFEQEAVMRRVLPLSQGALADIVRGITPEKGTYAGTDEYEGKQLDYNIEPSRSRVLKEILPRLANIIVFHTLLENKASEHSARMVAMKNATDKGGEVAAMLKRTFNKARQAAITGEVSEITTGMEAMK